MNREATVAETSLAAHLLCRAEGSSPDAYYRLARIVAWVLVSQRLRERRKWCDLAREPAARPEVEERLVRQAISWLERRSARAGSCLHPDGIPWQAGYPMIFSRHFGRKGPTTKSR